METWQLITVVAALTAAWFIDRRLFALLAAVAAATVALTWWQARGRRRDVSGPLRDAVAVALPGVRAGEGALLVARVSGIDIILALPTYEDAERRPRACLDVKVPAVVHVPLCFAARLRAAAVRVPPLVANAAVFEAPLECELEVARFEEPTLDDRLDLASTAPAALARTLDAGVRGALAPLLAGELGLGLVRYDGQSLTALLVPGAEPPDPALVTQRVMECVALARALDLALARVGAPPSDGPTGEEHA